ncbi:MAG TPA: hypothetical protein VNT01_18040 [Symbiobacteriaceae bacterium]|nr:hypothetical protein [Symbiobacteriaceae bacterium]
MRLLTQVRPVLVLLPRLSDDRIILLHQLQRWQLPEAPLLPGADLTAVATDLLHRTTDYVPGHLSALGTLDSGARCYLAEPLRPSPFLPVHAGRAMTTAVSPAELQRLAQLGHIACPTLLAALQLLIASI